MIDCFYATNGSLSFTFVKVSHDVSHLTAHHTLSSFNRISLTLSRYRAGKNVWIQYIISWNPRHELGIKHKNWLMMDTLPFNDESEVLKHEIVLLLLFSRAINNHNQLSVVSHSFFLPYCILDGKWQTCSEAKWWLHYHTLI